MCTVAEHDDSVLPRYVLGERNKWNPENGLVRKELRELFQSANKGAGK
ncbi:MAG TPA: hypothetical protein VIH48_02495 [Candidatus Bathyarchaeia archaeon]